MKELERILAAGDNKALAKYVDALKAEAAPNRLRAAEGRRYYENDNQIRRKGPLEEMLGRAKLEKNPLRSSDFRVSHNWHQLLVNQKVAYLFSYPPVFDCGDPDINDKLNRSLGEEFPRVVKNLAIDAANTGEGWLHLWLDRKGDFCYATVPGEELYCVYNGEIPGTLAYVIRDYTVDGSSGTIERKVEIWNEAEALFFKDTGEGLKPDRDRGGQSCGLCHGLGSIPFIRFSNNSSGSGDLYMVKDLIDQYDLVVSGFANDLADIQEVIFVLRNYGGEDLSTFLTELKRYKAIKVEGDAVGDGGVDTMQIEIPVEARVKFLELLKKQIFISGQGVNPDPEVFGNSSGVALKYLYSLLEIKAGLLETEFRAGFSRFLGLLLKHLGFAPDLPVTQIYSRNAIENEVENAEIAVASQGLISKRTILRNHPWVEDPQQEAEVIAEEERANKNDKDFK
ncbi:MAG: phage portal protein [Bacillota bacterium]|nr:phage portal protein [Bacillota bacterium]